MSRLTRASANVPRAAEQIGRYRRLQGGDSNAIASHVAVRTTTNVDDYIVRYQAVSAATSFAEPILELAVRDLDACEVDDDLEITPIHQCCP